MKEQVIPMAKSQSLATTKLAAELKKQTKNSLVKDILAEVDTASAIEKKGNNAAVRKAAHQKALAENNKIELARVSDAMSTLLPLGKKIAAKSDELMERGLTDDDAFELMRSYLDGKIVAESQAAIQDMVRTLVFRHMDLAATELGEEFPEHTNMEVDVPELGKRFCREGAGRKPAEFDMDKLRAVLGDDLFAQITTVKVTYEVNDSALSAAVVANPALMEQMRDAVVPGEWKSARLMVRDLAPNQE